MRKHIIRIAKAVSKVKSARKLQTAIEIAITRTKKDIFVSPQLSSDKGSRIDTVISQGEASSEFSKVAHPGSFRWIVKVPGLEKMSKNGQCLATVAPSRQPRQSPVIESWDPFPTRILYIGTLLYIYIYRVSPNTDRGSTLRIDGTPKSWSTDRKRRRFKKTFTIRALCFSPSPSSMFPSVVFFVSLSDFARLIARCCVIESNIVIIQIFASSIIKAWANYFFCDFLIFYNATCNVILSIFRFF